MAAYVAQDNVADNKYHGFNWSLNGSDGNATDYRMVLPGQSTPRRILATQGIIAPVIFTIPIAKVTGF